jgi:hypothetical protein
MKSVQNHRRMTRISMILIEEEKATGKKAYRDGGKTSRSPLRGVLFSWFLTRRETRVLTAFRAVRGAYVETTTKLVALLQFQRCVLFGCLTGS